MEYGQAPPPPNPELNAGDPSNTRQPLDVELPNEGPGSLKFWRDQVDGDIMLRDKFKSEWKTNLKRYNGARPNLWGIAQEHVVVTNIDFANTEAKKARLCFQTAELNLTARREQDVATAPLAAAVINDFMSQRLPMMDTIEEVLMDVICPAGIGAVVVGHEAYEGEPTQQQKMTEVPIEGSVTGRGNLVAEKDAAGNPVMESVPNIIRQRYFVERISPLKLIIPRGFDRANYDQADYLGYEDFLSVESCKGQFGFIPQCGRVQVDNDRLNDQDLANQLPPMFKVTVLWYRTSRIRPDVKDPERFSQLIYCGGRGSAGAGEVLVHRDSPYQTLDADGPDGKVVSGMIGNPIDVLTLRYSSDSCYPKSDCSMSRGVVDELSLSRSQMVVQRHRNQPMRWYNASASPTAKDAIQRMEKGQTQTIIPLNGDGRELIGVVSSAMLPQENFRFQDVQERDCSRIWAIGANQTGAADPSTATEAEIMQQNTETRLAKERNRVITWNCRVASKLFACVQLFADEQDYVPMIGPAGARIMKAWSKNNIQGLYTFTERMDSSLRVDAAQARAKFLQLYNLFRRDPLANAEALDRELMSQYGLNPDLFILKQAPAPAPAAPQPSLSIKGDDLDPRSPQFPIVMEILRSNGVLISDEAKRESIILASAADHPGRVPLSPTVDVKHQERTGKRTGPRIPGAPNAGDVIN